MRIYEIHHVDAEEAMYVEAETASKAKYKNFLSWDEAFGAGLGKGAFQEYLKGLEGCKRCGEVES